MFCNWDIASLLLDELTAMVRMPERLATEFPQHTQHALQVVDHSRQADLGLRPFEFTQQEPRNVRRCGTSA